MNSFWAELVGTMFLILLGDGVVAGVLLSKSKAENSGWIVITTGWGLAVAMGVYVSARISGGHINPAVTLALAAMGKFPWHEVPKYLAAQFLGAFLGAILVWLTYLAHWPGTGDSSKKLVIFCTIPAIRRLGMNLLTEIIATFGLMFGVLAIIANAAPMQSGLGPLLIGFLIWALGLSLGGPTGYAMNPARDFAPRLAHALLPIPGKGSSDWGYAWVPIVGPIIGSLLGAAAYVGIFGS